MSPDVHGWDVSVRTSSSNQARNQVLGECREPVLTSSLSPQGSLVGALGLRQVKWGCRMAGA